MAEAGRPSDYTDDMGLLICERLADGESLRSIGGDEGMPSQRTIYRWLAVHEGFRQQYARARETQADTIFDEILDIADNSTNDWMEKHGDQGENIGWRENGEAMQRAKLRVDARKWMASKLAPKKYGDSQLLKLAGEEGGPIQAAVAVTFRKSASPDDV